MRPFLYSTAPRPPDVLRPGFASCGRESSSVWSVRWAKPIIALSGVRISWLMFARKSLFALVALPPTTLFTQSSLPLKACQDCQGYAVKNFGQGR